MKRMSTQLPAIAFVFALCMSMGAPAPSAADTIRIGAILSLTGNTSEYGKSMRDGILLAVDEINKRGGVNGSRIDMIIEDSKSDPQVAVQAFNKMELTRPPLFYLSFLSSVGVALAPLADEKRVILVGLVTSSVSFTSQHDYVYRFWPPSQADVPPLLTILQDLKVKKLGIIYSNEEYGAELQTLLSKGFLETGGTVSAQSCELAEVDIQRQIDALKDQEAICVATLGTSLTNAIHQLRAVKYKGYILAPSTAANPAFLAIAEMQDVYVSSPIIYNQGYLYSREAGEKFVARYHTPFTHWAGAGYDFIKIISGLLEDRPASRQSIRDVLAAGFDYSGVFGQVRVRPGQHDLTFPMYPAQIHGNSLKFR